MTEYCKLKMNEKTHKTKHAWLSIIPIEELCLYDVYYDNCVVTELEKRKNIAKHYKYLNGDSCLEISMVTKTKDNIDQTKFTYLGEVIYK